MSSKLFYIVLVPCNDIHVLSHIEYSYLGAGINSIEIFNIIFITSAITPMIMIMLSVIIDGEKLVHR